MTTGFLWDERYLWHDTGHGALSQLSGGWIEPGEFAEDPATKRRLYSLIEVSGIARELTPLAPRPATVAELTRVHDPSYVEEVARLSAGFGGNAGESVPFHAGSYEVGLLAAGGAITALDAVLDGDVDNAYALVRPPGHHAERDRGRGFCLFGNCAVAVRHALEARLVERVAIVDWDVHHGNGTQDAFHEEPEVLTISVHGDDLYPPGRGGCEENGAGPGAGAALNVPLPAGSGIGAYLHAFSEVVVPALQAHRPDLIVVASGLDASAFDPLGRMILPADGYRQLTRIMLDAAAELTGGRLVLVHEGGYSAGYVPFCGLAILEALADHTTEVTDPFAARLASWPDQSLLSHQRERIAVAAALVEGVPRP